MSFGRALHDVFAAALIDEQIEAQGVVTRWFIERSAHLAFYACE